MLKAIVEKEWAEVRRNGVKTEDWSWTVTFYEGDVIDENPWLGSGVIDEHYINNEATAKLIAVFFEAGAFTRTEFGGVSFENVFEDVSDFELELEDWFEGEVDADTLEFEVING